MWSGCETWFLPSVGFFKASASLTVHHECERQQAIEIGTLQMGTAILNEPVDMLSILSMVVNSQDDDVPASLESLRTGHYPATLSARSHRSLCSEINGIERRCPADE